jgi:hypothetical protein
MEKKIFEILEKMKLEVITLDEAQRQLCVLFGVICSCNDKKEICIHSKNKKCKLVDSKISCYGDNKDLCKLHKIK